MLPNQESKLSSASIVAKHATHDQSTHGRGRTRTTGAGSPSGSAQGGPRQLVESKLKDTKAKLESKRNELKEVNSEITQFNQDIKSGKKFRPPIGLPGSNHPLNLLRDKRDVIDTERKDLIQEVENLQGELKTLGG
jgi:chromosome segregation ATPase